MLGESLTIRKPNRVYGNPLASDISRQAPAPAPRRSRPERAAINVRRRSLGIRIAETAVLLATNARTVRYWFSANGGEPRDAGQVMSKLADLETAMGDLVDSLAEEAIEQSKANAGRIAVVRVVAAAAQLRESGRDRGLPFGAWMAMGWLADDLRADGFTVRFEWSPPARPNAQ